ncbi:hypothetical protein NDN08_001322 [Rhodosorus marinus]|uniref:Uncharacterized protein n=1 Tax=Rhodosorus marinus TaxID=101924 RepID=A0AAV8UUP5_9RHOD|nr:hypothetical protein NDN08_001322 [Rhodosorus marinus]
MAMQHAEHDADDLGANLEDADDHDVADLERTDSVLSPVPMTLEEKFVSMPPPSSTAIGLPGWRNSYSTCALTQSVTAAGRLYFLQEARGAEFPLPQKRTGADSAKAPPFSP